MSDLIEYIRIQWTDIHHSRNQEWRMLAIIGAAVAALFATRELPLQIAIAVFALVTCIMGVYTSIAHWIIFYSKMRVIRECEKELGIEARFRSGPVPVQGVMVLAFFLLTSGLSGWLAWLLSGNLLISSVVSGTVFVVGLVLCIIPNSPLRKVVERSEQMPLTLRKDTKLPEQRLSEEEKDA